jgi:hypothetical protein
MKKPFVFVCALALLSAAHITAAEQDIITKSFTAKPGGHLLLKVDRGSIHITTSNSDKVDVKIIRELKRASASKAQEIYALHKIDLSQSGDTVKIEADNPQKSRLFGNNPFNHLHVEYNISVPSQFNLDVRTAGGNIEVSDLEGEVRAHTSGGNLNLGSIKGEIAAHTSGGNITVKGGTGNANLHTSGGHLRIGEIEGNLVAKTSGGNISLDRVKGSIEAETSGGDIRVKEAHGPVVARTSGGNVSAQLNEQPKADCSLRTSGGNVSVTLSEKVALDLNAHTSGGSIRSDFPGEMNKHRTKLVAQVNGGGPDLVLETSGGNVDIRKK